MEGKPAEVVTPVEVPRPPEPTILRPKFVQSTLFPKKSPDDSKKDNAIKEDENCDEEEDDRDDEDDEYCGSQTKRKKTKRKTNRTPKPRVSKKIAINGKEIPSKRVDDEGSPLIVKSDFFMKTSNRRHQLRQKKEQLSDSLPEEKGKTCSPLDLAANIKSSRKRRNNATPEKQHTSATPEKRRTNATPEKRHNNSTPRKKLINCDLEEALSSQGEHVSFATPDLRLEAKRAAEENSRIFAGRQIHPFFSSWKTGKKNQEIIDVDCNGHLNEGKDKNIRFNPIHVLEKVQDNNDFLDWRNWTFSESSCVQIAFPESRCLPVHEGSVKSLNFDNFTCTVNPIRKSLSQNVYFLDESAIQHKEVFSGHSPMKGVCLHATTATVMAAEPVALSEPIKEQDHENEAEPFSRNVGCSNGSYFEWQGQFLPERMMLNHHDCGARYVNSLWTNKYQPEKAIEICGNGESVKFISDWLRLWHERGSQPIKDGSSFDKWNDQDIEYSGDLSDSDSENMDEDNGLKNVLLVIGPVGSGKSAAIYACAKEQGFQIIEINASDWRSGALVKQRVGEAAESHWLQRSSSKLENPANMESKRMMKCTTCTPNAKNEVFELISVSDEDDYRSWEGMPGKRVCKENKAVGEQSEVKTLILFEDVDAIPYEDRGLITTVQQLALTAKRPIILTSNCNISSLPNNFDRLEVHFDIPSSEELLPLVNMVCATEKAKIQPCLVERFIEYFHGDIRKTIMHLQFWYQGQPCKADTEVQKAFGSLLFDLDAGHYILPKLTSWEYHSKLSEIVEKEIRVAESSRLSEIVEEEQDNDEEQNSLEMHDSEADNIEAKKEAMLRRYCSIEDFDEYPAKFNAVAEIPNALGSPCALPRRNVRRKFSLVVSSDSEEALSNEYPAASGKLFEDANNEGLPEASRKSPSHLVAIEQSLDPLNELFVQVNGENLEHLCYFSGVADHIQNNGISEAVDISSVPESTFVPETEIDSGTMLPLTMVSCGHGADMEEAISISNTSMEKILAVEDSNINIPFTDLSRTLDMFRSTCDTKTESVHGEEVGDSLIEHVKVVPRGYQVMDECSRVVFSRGFDTIEKVSPMRVENCVQEAWRKLRHCHMDLRQYVTLEEKNASKVLDLAYEMSNLISEADLLLSYCQPLLCDVLEPSTCPLEKSHSFGWYDDQLQMASTTAEHGICYYAKEVGVIGSQVDSSSRIDLAWEMVKSSNNAMALGKLVSQDREIGALEIRPPDRGISSKQESDSSYLCNIVESIVPARSYSMLTGEVFHEYLSSLSQISRSETSRLSANSNMTRRRARVPRHYLSSSGLMLSPEDISSLNKYNGYKKVSSSL